LARVNRELKAGVKKHGRKKRPLQEQEIPSVVSWGFGLPKKPAAPEGDLSGKAASKAWAIRPSDKRRR
jgi:hypothetical protein